MHPDPLGAEILIFGVGVERSKTIPRIGQWAKSVLTAR
jgi:hypothetical protein